MRQLTLSDLKIIEIFCTTEGDISFTYEVYDENNKVLYSVVEEIDSATTVLDQDFRNALMGLISYAESKARTTEQLPVVQTPPA